VSAAVQTLADLNTDLEGYDSGLNATVLISIQAERRRAVACCVIQCSRGAFEVNAAAMQTERR